jgi:hypothetical protein
MKYGPNMLDQVDLAKPETYMTNPYPVGFEKVDIPEGISGEWSVTKVSINIDKVGLYNLRVLRDGMPKRIIPEGNYTRLCHSIDVIMSDTPAEAHEHLIGYHEANGNVLINGLGLGFFLKALINKPTVRFITVIEKSEDVLKLVSQHYQNDRVAIICADAFDWQPRSGERFDYVWHDIWPEIDDDNKLEMKELRNKYRHYANKQGCWSETYL